MRPLLRAGVRLIITARIMSLNPHIAAIHVLQPTMQIRKDPRQ